MAHQLRVATEDASGPNATWLIAFEEDLESQIEALLGEVANLPASWSTTRYETDLARYSWSVGGSRDQLSALLYGCQQHGWPFVAYVYAHRQADPSTWFNDYEATYLGWWADRRAFALEIAAAGDHFADESSAADLAQGTIDEICGGFLCLDVDGRVVVFDELVGK